MIFFLSFFYFFFFVRAGETKRLDGLPGRIDVQFRSESHSGQAAARQREPVGEEEAGRPEGRADVVGDEETEKIA